MDWFQANKLTLNLSKSVCMLFLLNCKYVKFNIEIEGVEIPEVDCTKFLGVWIDQNLKWEKHVNNLVLKLKRNHHLLRTSKNLLNTHAKKIIYFSHVQSHVTYCLSVWGNMLNQSQLVRIDKVLLDCISNVKQNMNCNQNSQYLNSILCKGPKLYGDINHDLKRVVNYSTFISKCKKQLLSTQQSESA